jgi:hypothetical protein
MTTLRYFFGEHKIDPMLRSLKRRSVILSAVVMNYLKRLVVTGAIAVRIQGNQMI